MKFLLVNFFILIEDFCVKGCFLFKIIVSFFLFKDIYLNFWWFIGNVVILIFILLLSIRFLVVLLLFLIKLYVIFG